MTEDHKRNISKSVGKGKANHNYKDGSGMKGRWHALKIKARIRDDYTCQVCGLREPDIMEVDHIRPQSVFPELRFELNNLVILCPNCHKRKTIRDKKQYNW